MTVNQWQNYKLFPRLRTFCDVFRFGEHKKMLPEHLATFGQHYQINRSTMNERVRNARHFLYSGFTGVTSDSPPSLPPSC